MFLKGRIKADKEKIGLIKTVLEPEGIKVEESENEVFFNEDINPLYFSRTKSHTIFEKIKDIGAQEIDLLAYSVVEIYRYKFQNGEVETHD